MESATPEQFGNLSFFSEKKNANNKDVNTNIRNLVSSQSQPLPQVAARIQQDNVPVCKKNNKRNIQKDDATIQNITNNNAKLENRNNLDSKDKFLNAQQLKQILSNKKNMDLLDFPKNFINY